MKINHLSIRALLTLAALSTTALPAALQAQIEEIVVTAQKREQDANDVGITMNIMTGELVKNLGISVAEDLGRFTPGLNVNESYPVGVPQYTIRGVGFQNLTTSASSTVGLYQDGANIPYTVMSRGALFDLERVEILRGPQGDLYGRNTTGGQINFVSKKPTDEFEAGFTASYGSYHTLDFDGFVSGPLASNARGRVAYKTTQAWEGWQESLTRNDELGEKDMHGLRAILDLDVSDAISMEINFRYGRDKSDNQAPAAYDPRQIGAGIALFPYNPLQNHIDLGSYTGLDSLGTLSLTSTPPWFAEGKDPKDADWTNSYTNPISGITHDLRPQRDNESIGVSGRMEWEFGGLKMVSLTAYDEFDRREAFDSDGGAFVDASNTNVSRIEVFSQELIFSGATERLTWLAGLYYSSDDVDEEYRLYMADSGFGFGSIPFNNFPFALSPVLELDTTYTQNTESRALFGHVEWEFTERFKLTLGARYTDEDIAWSGCTFSTEDNSLGAFMNTLFGASLGPGDCGIINDDLASPNSIFNAANPNDAFQVYSDSISTDKAMGKAGLDFRVNDDILLYFIVSHGFKSGGFNGAQGNTTSQLIPYRPEKLTAFEFGSKMTLLDNRMQFNASAFYYDYKDKQEGDIAVTFVGNIVGLTNVPESEVYGVEVEMDYAPITGLDLHLGAAWLESEVKEWQAVDPINSVWPNIATLDASGGQLPQAPEWSVNALANYRWPLSDALYLELGADVNYAEGSPGAPGGGVAFGSSDYTLLNARLGLGSVDNKWRVQVWSRNLTDEYYYPSASSGNGPFIRMVGMPRTLGVKLDYNF